MEAELDTALGYDKQERRGESGEASKPRNYRNEHTSKTVKTQLGEVNVSVTRGRNGELEPKIIGKYSRNADGIMDRILDDNPRIQALMPKLVNVCSAGRGFHAWLR